MASPEHNNPETNMTRKNGLRPMAVAAGIGIFSATVVRYFEQGHLGVTPPEFMQGHMHDSLGALAMSYYAKVLYNANPSINALVAFFTASAAEVAQGAKLWEGTFDPKDFVAYGLGVSTYYAIEKISGRRKVDMQPGTEYSVNPDIDQESK